MNCDHKRCDNCRSEATCCVCFMAQFTLDPATLRPITRIERIWGKELHVLALPEAL